MVVKYLCDMLHVKRNQNYYYYNDNSTPSAVSRRISLSSQYRLSQQDLSREPIDIRLNSDFRCVEIDDDMSDDHDFTSNIKSMIIEVNKYLSFSCLYLI